MGLGFLYRPVTDLLAERNDLLLNVKERHGLRVPDDGRDETFGSGDRHAQVDIVAVYDLVALNDQNADETVRTISLPSSPTCKSAVIQPTTAGVKGGED